MPVALGPLTQSSIALATPCAVSAARIGVVDDGAAALSGAPQDTQAAPGLKPVRLGSHHRVNLGANFAN
jgi:hypothetical protein